MTSKPEISTIDEAEVTAESASALVDSVPPPAKIPSVPVVSVGTPSRPPPGMPSRPLIRSPIPPPVSLPGSEPAPSKESVPPGGRKLAPPPKPRRESLPAPRRDSAPAPADGTPREASIPPPAIVPDLTAKEPSSDAKTAPKSERPQAPDTNPVAEKAAAAAEKPAPSQEKPAPSQEKPAPASSLAPRPVVLPPRPAATPEIAAPAPADARAAPAVASSSELGLSSGGGAARASPPKRITKPPPRRSEPPAPAHVIVPTETVPQASKPTPAPAIQVMRIIAIGTKAVQTPAPIGEADVIPTLDDDFDEVTPAVPRAAAISEVDRVEASSASAAVEPEPTELDDADLSPDSQEGRRSDEAPRPAASAVGEAAEELGREDALSVPPDAPEFPPEPSSAPQAAPPPPPRRTPSPPKRPDSNRPNRKRALKKPWWEEVFGEDFTRAIPPLTERQIKREVDFIEESLGVAKGGVVLDLGCGSGAHAVELATRGYGVVGYDLSVYQLALAADIAQQREQKINFLQGDMREMAFEETFDGIYCWNTTFGYFEEDKNFAVAERVFKALKPGGMFLVDVANRDYAAQYTPSQLWYEGDSCVCMDDMSLDFITSRLRVKRSLIFDDGRSRESVYSIRLYSLHELGKLLHDAGFRVAEASGHTATPGVFFGEISPRLLVLAQRP
ncbi:MAG TPA: methyltransferase domain-containing protein [Polyangiaceae bacterium]